MIFCPAGQGTPTVIQHSPAMNTGSKDVWKDGATMVDANQGWKSLGELTKLSEKELRHEKIKRCVGLILGPLLFLIIAFLIPTPEGMTEKAQWYWALRPGW